MKVQRSLRGVRLVCWILAAGSAATAITCYGSYRQDCAHLRDVAGEATHGATQPSDKVLALLHWVHDVGGSARNQRYFLMPGVGATPVQVMEGGGDCADKSRLLSALLRVSDIPATMAMCRDPQSGRPSHVFVEARIENDGHMAVDPAYDLHFPKPGRQGYFGLLDLRRDPSIVARRVDELCALTPNVTTADRYYMRASASYELAGTVNWNRNAVTRFLYDRLEARYGENVHRIPRPLLLEEPKLFVAGACGLFGFGCVSLAAGLTWVSRSHRFRDVGRGMGCERGRYRTQRAGMASERAVACSHAAGVAESHR